MDQQSVLKQYFGHVAFRPGQEALVEALLAGRDVLGVMPTGAGKSVCYQVPALMLPGITLVVSPLISLMQDQVTALGQAGVPVAFINSSLTSAQYYEVFRRAEAGEYKIIYVAPERLDTADFVRFANGAHISLVAVDEAHCVSQWGQDFRPSYLRIVEFIQSLSQRPAVGAFTATATTEVKKDIAHMLQLHDPLSLTTGFDRANLYFEVISPKNKLIYLRELLRQRPGKSGIIYCATRKNVELVCAQLLEDGISAAPYHAGLSDGVRRQNQEDFVFDRTQVMVATNAFGMGIDKSNVSFVIHYNMPKNLESYYQEAGRAGRDGEKADCILLFSNGDVQMAKFLIENSSGNESRSSESRAAVTARDMERLSLMTTYCKTKECLRAYLIHYFGETHDGQCGNCGNCLAEYSEIDITVTAQKILSCVARCEKNYSFGLGLTLYVNVLHGSREQKILQLGLNSLSTYGILREMDRSTIRAYMDELLEQGHLQLADGEYPVVHLGASAGDVLFRAKSVSMSVKQQPAAARQGKPPRSRSGTPQMLTLEDEGLYGALKSMRTKLAQEANVPAYIVFSNATLTDMAAKAPRTMADFLEVSGIGEVKAQRYGDDFLSTIRAYLDGAGEEEEELPFL